MKVYGKYLYKATIVAKYEGHSVHKPCLLLADDYLQAADKLAEFCEEEKQDTGLDWKWMAVRVVDAPRLQVRPETFGAYKGALMEGYTPISHKMCPNCNQYELTMTEYREGAFEGYSWESHVCNKCLTTVEINIRSFDEEE